MPTRSNKHIKKFNQLVDVYEPDGVEPLETVQSRDSATLQQRKDALAEYRERVETLGVAEFFDDERQRELRDSERHPDPDEVADSQREEMLDRLESIEAALSDAIDGGEVFDTDEALDW